MGERKEREGEGELKWDKEGIDEGVGGCKRVAGNVSNAVIVRVEWQND